MYQGDQQSQIDLRLLRIWAKATKVLFDNIRKDIERYGIRPEHFMIIELLYSKGPQTVQVISEKFSIPSGSITYVVNKLEKKGLVKRQPCPSDRRSSYVVLTEQGTDFLDDMFPQFVETISKNLSFVSNEEKELLTELIKKIGLGATSLQ